MWKRLLHVAKLHVEVEAPKYLKKNGAKTCPVSLATILVTRQMPLKLHALADSKIAVWQREDTSRFVHNYLIANLGITLDVT